MIFILFSLIFIYYFHMIFNEEYCKYIFKILKNSYILGTQFINPYQLCGLIDLNYGYKQDQNIIDLFINILIDEIRSKVPRLEDLKVRRIFDDSLFKSVIY